MPCMGLIAPFSFLINALLAYLVFPLTLLHLFLLRPSQGHDAVVMLPQCIELSVVGQEEGRLSCVLLLPHRVDGLLGRKHTDRLLVGVALKHREGGKEEGKSRSIIRSC